MFIAFAVRRLGIAVQVVFLLIVLALAQGCGARNDGVGASADSGSDAGTGPLDDGGAENDAIS